MPVMSKVTIIVEPLDGSVGQRLEVPRAMRVELEHRYDEPQGLGRMMTPIVVPEDRLVGITLEIDLVSDPHTGVGYELRRI